MYSFIINILLWLFAFYIYIKLFINFYFSKEAKLKRDIADRAGEFYEYLKDATFGCCVWLFVLYAIIKTAIDSISAYF